MKKASPRFLLRQNSLLRRAVAVVLIPVLLLDCKPVLAEVASSSPGATSAPQPDIPTPVTTPTHVKANRMQPKFTPASSTFSLSSQPSDAEITNEPLFAEPLLPVGAKTTAADNAALAQALTSFAQRKVRDNYSALESYLSGNQHSPWQLSLLVNMGWLYRQTGWYSKAMDMWQTAWTEGQAMGDPRAKPLADRALAELIVLNARVGRMDQLQQLIPLADRRHLTGSSKEKVEAAKQALVLMQKQPGKSFRCGPMALEKIRNLVSQKSDPSKLAMSMESTQQGTNLLQLKKLSQKMGLNYQVAKRQPGSEVLAPAVVNWKMGHYAAVLGQDKKTNLWHLHDPTFGKDVWVSTDALDQEASGYFLVPSGALPTGWTAVSDTEAATVWGKGQNQGPNGNNNKNGPKCPNCPTSNGMARYSVYESTTSLSLDDTPLFYTPAYGPTVKFTVSYSQREANQPSTFNYTSLGSLWTCNWLSYITDDPDNPGGDVTEYEPSGGTLTYTGYDGTSTYAPEQQTMGVLKITSSSSYELDLPDGSKQIYGVANSAYPRQVFMTQSVDPQGNALTYSYDSHFRIVSVTDSTGLVTTVNYGSSQLSSPLYYNISTVIDPFGRTATLDYDNNGNLITSTDMIGIVSHYNYYGGSLTSLTTPYGTTTFDVGEDDDKRWVQINDAAGGQQRVETWNNTNPNVAASAGSYPSGADNSYLNYRNTFYWDQEQMMACAGSLDYSKAEVTHWLHEPDYTTMSDVPENVKEPLEDAIYYSYLDQPANIVTGTNGAPTQVRRILSNGHTQTIAYTNNVLGLPTQVTDPLSRITNYSYAPNNIDVIQKSQVNGGNADIISTTTYNNQHEPLTITNASGQQTSYTYRTNGQIASIVTPDGATKNFSYNAKNQLTSMTDQQTGAATTLTYDGYGRVRTKTDINGYTLTYDYDNLDRVTKVTYPDSTYDQNTYTNLSLTLQKDRQGHVTRYLYNAIEQIVGKVDSLGRGTSYIRCTCGALLGVTDPLGHRTSWSYDLEGRPLTKTYDDNSQYSFTYDVGFTSNLLSITDPKTQTTSYQYNDDDTIHKLSYTDAAVLYTYDTSYRRILGATKTMLVSGASYPTSFSYNPVYSSGAPITGGGKVSEETGPLGSTAAVSYGYDSMDRNVDTSINGYGSNLVYDSLGRLTGNKNPLASFTYGYAGSTFMVTSVRNNQNGINSSLSYETGSAGDCRLADISNHSSGSTILSKFDYTYNPVGTLATTQEQADNNTPTLWTYGYDSVSQLTSAVQSNTATNAVLSQFFYGYDSAGNRTTRQSGLSTAAASFNSLNQLTSVTPGGSLEFSGNLDKPGTVTIAGQAASMDSTFEKFSGQANVTTGTNTVSVVATSANGYANTNNYQVVVPSASDKSPIYDADGNMTNNGRGQSYTWDAENELTSITYTDNSSSQFTYDAFGRRISIVETNSSGVVTSTKQFVWIGGQVAEERDASNAVTKRFFMQGEQIGGTNYYYTRDSLGSIREMVDSDGVVKARYNYDPYGNPTKVSGTMDSDFQYAGYYEHQASHLNLTWYRAYDGKAGKWLSRDPAQESAGLNLYAYCDNQPNGKTDRTGLCPECDAMLQQAEAAQAALPGLQKAVADAQQDVAEAYIGLGIAVATLAVSRYAVAVSFEGGPLGVAVALAFLAIAYAAVAAAGVHLDTTKERLSEAQKALQEGQQAAQQDWQNYLQCEKLHMNDPLPSPTLS